MSINVIIWNARRTMCSRRIPRSTRKKCIIGSYNWNSVIPIAEEDVDVPWKILGFHQLSNSSTQSFWVDSPSLSFRKIKGHFFLSWCPSKNSPPDVWYRMKTPNKSLQTVKYEGLARCKAKASWPDMTPPPPRKNVLTLRWLVSTTCKILSVQMGGWSISSYKLDSFKQKMQVRKIRIDSFLKRVGVL